MRDGQPSVMRALASAPEPAEVADSAAGAERARAFHWLLDRWTSDGRPGAPHLVLPDAPVVRRGRCVSCGARIRKSRWRCEVCIAAVHEALGSMR
jgi:hypothetical protein